MCVGGWYPVHIRSPRSRSSLILNARLAFNMALRLCQIQYGTIGQILFSDVTCCRVYYYIIFQVYSILLCKVVLRSSFLSGTVQVLAVKIKKRSLQIKRSLQTKKDLKESLVIKYPKSGINGLWEERSRWTYLDSIFP